MTPNNKERVRSFVHFVELFGLKKTIQNPSSVRLKNRPKDDRKFLKEVKTMHPPPPPENWHVPWTRTIWKGKFILPTINFQEYVSFESYQIFPSKNFNTRKIPQEAEIWCSIPLLCEELKMSLPWEKAQFWTQSRARLGRDGCWLPRGWQSPISTSTGHEILPTQTISSPLKEKILENLTYICINLESKLLLISINFTPQNQPQFTLASRNRDS